MTRRALETTRGRLTLLGVAVAVLLLGSAAIAYFAFDEYGTSATRSGRRSCTCSILPACTTTRARPQRTIGLFQVVTGLVLLVGLLFTFVAEVVASSLERLGQTDRPVRADDHLLIIGGLDLISVAAAAAAAERPASSSGSSRLVVLAPESARDSRGQSAPT